jgi:UDP-glucose:(heptosyl)LPS alpha-1,3-glucosyltransferase
MVARDIARHHGWPADRMRVVYNGVDAEKFSPHLRHTLRAPLRLRLGLRNERLLLIVAHNFELKGVPALLRATALLVQDGRPIHLAVVGGKPSALPAYRRAARRLGIDAAVTFAGPVADAAPWYAAADVYVQPTFYDPCSLVVLEALACGLPVITSRYNGAGELLNEGVEGFVLDDPSDDRRLAERIELLLDDELREHMARQARRRALRCTFDHNGQAIVDVYHQVKAATRRAA